MPINNKTITLINNSNNKITVIILTQSSINDNIIVIIKIIKILILFKDQDKATTFLDLVKVIRMDQ